MKDAPFILRKFIQWYSEKSCDQESHFAPDVIVPLSYCTTPQGLTRATKENFLNAIAYWQKWPHAPISFGNTRYLFHDAAERESHFKAALLRENGVPEHSVLEAGPIMNSVEEARSINVRLSQADIHPARILIITGSLHARSARLIWKKIFPRTEIMIRCIDYRLETQKDHPVFVQRSLIPWCLANVIRHTGLLIFGLTISSLFHHRASLP